MSNPALNYTMFTVSKQTATDNASFAFGKPLGSKFDLGYTDTTYGSRALGVYCARTMLTVGPTAAGMEAPINKAARTLYTRYWEKNSSISNFQPQDITVYTFGSAQCVALLGWLCTVYGVRKVANPNSEYSKNILWRALGINAVDIGNHLTDLRGYINQKIIDLQNVRLDQDLPIYLYADNMYKHIYMDSPNTSKTQYYLTRPGKVLKYVKDGEGIGSLTYVNTLDVDDPNLTYAQLTEFVDSIFAAFFNSAYIASISAAIGKAKSSFYKYQELSEAYEVKPYFDARALIRFKNATVHAKTVNASDIRQDVINQTVSCTINTDLDAVGYIEDLGVNEVRAFKEGKQFLHAFSEKTETPEESIVTGSWMYSGSYINVDDDVYIFLLRQYGFEIITGALAYIRMDDGYGIAQIPSFWLKGTSDAVDFARAAQLAKDFDFIPTIRMFSGISPSPRVVSTIVDTDDYVVLGNDELYKLHRAGIYAILGVPMEG